MESEVFFEFMNNELEGFEEDRTFAVQLFKTEIANSSFLYHFFEEMSIHWIDDLDLCCSMVLKTLKSIPESGKMNVLPLYKDNDDEKEFIVRLIRRTIECDKVNEELIQDLAQNWDLDRIAKMDMILLKMAITELQNFSSIPTKVTLNEYIEISKFYSTPKSNIFINGILDKAIVRLTNENIDRIVASLALKEINQSTLVRKLCNLPQNNKTRKAVFEYNKLIRDIYTLKCILNPQMLADAHRSQNRLESYHTLRASIARVGGRKGLIGRTDLEIAIANKTGRLLATCVIFYNAFIQSRILEIDPHNKKLISKLKKSSPVAWKHIHFGGNFSFYSKNKIDINEIIKKIIL
jgi:transcription antitermination factor NusB